MSVKVNPEVFKLKTPSVEMLRSGRISADVFAATLGPGSPVVLVGDTLYALSEEEFYASRALKPINVMTEEGFRAILDMGDLSFMHRIDRAFIDHVRADLPNCSRCRYNRYKDEVYKIAKKYSLHTGAEAADIAEAVESDKAEYPETESPVVPLVSSLVQGFYKVSVPGRKPCIDCVEKHIGQAAVLAGEIRCGYPEHVIFFAGHLGEALDELPVEFDALRRSLEYCLARTVKSGIPFLPVNAIAPLVDKAREALSQSMADQSDSIAQENADTMPLDFTDQMQTELMLCPPDILAGMQWLLREADRTAGLPDVGSADRIEWEGCLACAADACSMVCPEFARMLRSRRLLFVGGIQAASGEFGLKDIIEYISRCLTLTNID